MSNSSISPLDRTVTKMPDTAGPHYLNFLNQLMAIR